MKWYTVEEKRPELGDRCWVALKIREEDDSITYETSDDHWQGDDWEFYDSYYKHKFEIVAWSSFEFPEFPLKYKVYDA